MSFSKTILTVGAPIALVTSLIASAACLTGCLADAGEGDEEQVASAEQADEVSPTATANAIGAAPAFAGGGFNGFPGSGYQGPPAGYGGTAQPGGPPPFVNGGPVGPVGPGAPPGDGDAIAPHHGPGGPGFGGGHGFGGGRGWGRGHGYGYGHGGFPGYGGGYYGGGYYGGGYGGGCGYGGYGDGCGGGYYPPPCD